MAYIVLETHGGPEYAIVCMNEDGTTAVFDTKKEAESFAEEDCQRGIVVCLSKNLPPARPRERM